MVKSGRIIPSEMIGKDLIKHARPIIQNTEFPKFCETLRKINIRPDWIAEAYDRSALDDIGDHRTPGTEKVGFIVE